MAKWAFDILGIEVTREEKEIKRAYAELVKKYHPEENPEEWTKAHEAYNVAMRYAQSEETTVENCPEEPVYAEQPKPAEEEIQSDENYNNMFQQVRDEWTQDQKEQNKRLEQRMYELMQMKNKNAYAQWNHFFETEFTEDVEISVMQILLEIVQVYPLRGEIVRLIMNTMSARVQRYQTLKDDGKAMVAAQIARAAQAQIPKQMDQSEHRRVKKGKTGRTAGILAVCCIALVAGSIMITSAVKGVKNREVLKQAVKYLDEKYGESGYEVSDLELEEAYLSGDSREKLKAYFIMEKGEYNRTIYAIAEKGKSDYTYFDNLQSREIKQAFQNELNAMTGRSEGKLLWNSSSGSDGAMEDGYFHERYEGDFDSFIEKETKVRDAAQKARAKRMNGSSTAKNGNCNYYLPDLDVETMEQRLTMKEIPQDKKLQEIMEKYAEEYEVQLRGIVLPGRYFEANLKNIRLDNSMYFPEENIYDSQIEPDIPFLIMTGWYVGLSAEDANLLNTQSATYTVKPVLVSDGVYAATESISGNETNYKSSELEGSFMRTEVPESVKLSDAQKEKAISIRFKGNKELHEYLYLAIDKKVCGITEEGYQVFITEYSGEEEQTSEIEVLPYQEEYSYLGYRDALDGEGYIYMEYPNYYDWDFSPVVITIVNP